jgi:hypothetical protein
MNWAEGTKRLSLLPLQNTTNAYATTFQTE